jgi:hypothetical protein
MRNTAAVVLDNMHYYLTEQELKVGEIKVIFLQSNVTFCEPVDKNVRISA